VSYRGRFLACALASLSGHILLAYGMRRLPPGREAPPPRRVEVRVVEARPPPEPPPEARPAPPPEPPRVAERPRSRTAPPAEEVAERPRAAPPSERLATAAGTSTTPIFGVTLESTAPQGTGPVLPLGNTVRARPTGRAAPAGEVKPLAAAIEGYEATRLPLPEGTCTGRYTPAAREAAVEGTVVLDLVVGEDGRVREVKVVQGLSHGLTEAATAAVQACRFTPGERQGKPVAVRIRGFKIRFYLQQDR